MTPPFDPLGWLDAELTSLGEAQLLRSLRTRGTAQGPTIALDGRTLINFGSNDYLSLAGDPRLAVAAHAAIEAEGVGSGASPLVTGRGESQRQLEAALAQLEGCEAALLFPSGFAANAGTVPALAGRGDAIFADAKNHASLIDGCRLSKAETHIYRHADCDHLAELLAANGPAARRRLIVTDGLFSMDGDLAPLESIAELAARHEAMLLVDEAHATGVFGPHGRGVAEALGVEHAVDVRVGTLSKALGCGGGFVAGKRTLIDWLANRARSYVFSTAQPGSVASAALAAIEIVKTEPHRRQRLLAEANKLRQRLAAAGWNVGASASPIIPIFVGTPQRAMQLSAALAEQGLFVPGIRPPTVPSDESLLRISLTFGHRGEMIDRLLAALGTIH
ncbi:MAG: 8-amino-7-oxononanoate synthase [Planctomycetia bacterium]|nr:8-amino-7-oxononanoate synthase [Planctomycetia bacterium]